MPSIHEHLCAILDMPHVTTNGTSPRSAQQRGYPRQRKIRGLIVRLLYVQESLVKTSGLLKYSRDWVLTVAATLLKLLG